MLHIVPECDRQMCCTGIQFAQLFGVTMLLLAAFDSASANDDGNSAAAAYGEPHRPQFHFTPPSMWMNDPNGMVYYDGEYHLFYQYYPDDTVWGPMHWGHAISRDLVTWQHLPIALYPDKLGYIFSGSAVVDWRNTSGLGTGGKPPLVAIFTYHDPVRAKAGTNDHEYQGIAYSNDGGRIWTKYDGNPVLANLEKEKDFRDPNVFWHAPTSRWVMTLSVHDRVEFWASKNLEDWQYLSSFGEKWGAHGGTWECPDLFPLTVSGTGETRWVLLLNLNPGGPQGGSGTQYFVGDFDGERFELDPSFAATLEEQSAVWLDWGSDDYAGVTWSDVPPADGRRIFIGWMSNWNYAQAVPTHPWRSAMTLPRTLTLHDTGSGYRVYSVPVGELAKLEAESVAIPEMKVAGTVDLSGRVDFPVSTSRVVLEFRIDNERAGQVGVVLSNGQGERYRIGFDADADAFYSDRRQAGDHAFSDRFADRLHRAPREADSDIVRLDLYFDVASAELFADSGATVITETFFPTVPFDRIALEAGGDDVTLLGGKITRLHSVW